MLVALICPILVAAGSACSAPAKKPNKQIIIPPPVKVSERDKATNVLPGQRIEISLPGNPTTGYQWVLAKPVPKGLVTVREPQFKPSGNQVGSPGIITLTYKMNRAGTAVLRLAYRRPWEKNVPPAKRFQLKLVVSPTKTY